MSSLIANALGYAHGITNILFPHSRPAVKLQQEAAELQAAIDAGDEEAIREELADCFICLAHIVSPERFRKLAGDIYVKCDVLIDRKWIFDEDTQTYQHVKETL